jgi:hypothetical protein
MKLQARKNRCVVRKELKSDIGGLNQFSKTDEETTSERSYIERSQYYSRKIIDTLHKESS